MQFFSINCKMIVIFFISVLSFGATYAQMDPSASDILKALPTNLQGNVNKSQIQDAMNKSTETLKVKCEKNGGDAEIVEETKPVKQ